MGLIDVQTLQWEELPKPTMENIFEFNTEKHKLNLGKFEMDNKIITGIKLEPTVKGLTLRIYGSDFDFEKGISKNQTEIKELADFKNSIHIKNLNSESIIFEFPGPVGGIELKEIKGNGNLSAIKLFLLPINYGHFIKHFRKESNYFERMKLDVLKDEKLLNETLEVKNSIDKPIMMDEILNKPEIETVTKPFEEILGKTTEKMENTTQLPFENITDMTLDEPCIKLNNISDNEHIDHTIPIKTDIKKYPVQDGDKTLIIILIVTIILAVLIFNYKYFTGNPPTTHGFEGVRLNPEMNGVQIY